MINGRCCRRLHGSAAAAVRCDTNHGTNRTKTIIYGKFPHYLAPTIHAYVSGSGLQAAYVTMHTTIGLVQAVKYCK